jgi:hypothetical protein
MNSVSGCNYNAETKLITKVTTKIIEDQLKVLANKLMDVFIYALNETLRSIEAPVLSLMKNSLYLLNKTKNKSLH